MIPSYPIVAADLLIALALVLLGLVVASLRKRMRRVERRLEPLAAVPDQVREMHTLLNSALPAMQQRGDELEALVIDSNEKLRADVLRAIREIPTCKATK